MYENFYGLTGKPFQLGPDASFFSNSEELQNYILHRLSLVGWDHNALIHDEVFDGIFEFTGGVPHRVNTLCDRLLACGCLEEKHHIDHDVLNKVIDEIKRDGWRLDDVEGGHKFSSGKTNDITQVAAESDLVQRLETLETEINSLRVRLTTERHRVDAMQLRMDMDQSQDQDDEHDYSYK